MDALTWTQGSVAGVPLNHFVAQAGAVEAGAVTFDASNGFWVWASPLSDEAWGYAPTADGAKQALTLWLRAWLENFRPLLDAAPGPLP